MQAAICVSVGMSDVGAAISAAKILSEKDVKKTKKVKFKAGLLEDEILDASAAAALAGLPDHETLRSMMLGVISGPARALACVINAVPAATARVLQAHADELEKAEA